MIQVGPPRFYQPVGRCIYCGTAEGPLTDEHILPFALGGNLILPKASCEAHRKTTQRIERTCATKMFGAYRVRVGGPTQSPKKWPDTIPLVAMDSSGREIQVKMPAEKHPSSVPLFHMGPPSILSGIIADEFSLSPWMHFPDARVLGERAADFPGSKIRIGVFIEDIFLRMIAKIAHAAMIAEVGMSDECFYPLRRIVLGTYSRSRKYIGGYMYDFPPDNGIPHWLQIYSVEKNGKLYFVAHIRLYAYLGSPVYIAVCGIMSDLKYKSNQTVSCEKFLNAKMVEPPTSV